MDLKKEVETIKNYLDIEEKHGDTKSISHQALKLKYDALTMVPTTIQKTMTPAQLYTSNSPLWAHDYKAVTIECILPHLKDKPRTEETFNEALEAIRVRTAYVDKNGKTYFK